MGFFGGADFFYFWVSGFLGFLGFWGFVMIWGICLGFGYLYAFWDLGIFRIVWDLGDLGIGVRFNV